MQHKNKFKVIINIIYTFFRLKIKKYIWKNIDVWDYRYGKDLCIHKN